MRAVLNKYPKQQSTKQQLYDYSLPISQTIQEGQYMLDTARKAETNSLAMFPSSFSRTDTSMFAD